MSLHVLSAGSGYTYLTRQVAVGDTTERGYSSLGDYYSVKGEAPGVWGGGGLESLEVAGRVTEQQMLNLFGEGIHPDADLIAEGLFAVQPAPGDRAKVSVREVMRRTALGAKFKVSEGGQEWRENLVAAYARFNTDHGHAANGAVPEADKQRIRTELAGSMFAEKYGRPPLSDQELTGFLAQVSRPQSTAVAGFDLTFSPVKSVSTLWAVAPRGVSEKIEAAHQAAVDKTMAWVQSEASYTRTGAGGVAQVDIRGLVFAMFTHRDSRAGDPDLHTHVAVSNKVQTLDGRWLALDSRLIHRFAVAASEHYNTALEAEFVARVGGRFEERQTEPGKQPIRELVGVEAVLNERFSSRRRAIDAHRGELVSKFQADHGRLPTTVELLSLAQQANLATREAKHEPRSLAEQRDQWRDQALETVGGKAALDAMVEAVLSETAADPVPVTPALLNEMTLFTVDAVMARRAQWRETNLLAEAFRQARGAGVDPAEMIDVALLIAEYAAAPEHSVPIGMDTEITHTPTPAALRRLDGTSQFRVAKAQLYTCAQILDAETRIVTAAGRGGARTLTATELEIGLLEWAANNGGRTLNAGQSAMVTSVATSDKYLQLVLAPAGSGKTTAMGALALAHMSVGGTVLGLAPQASAAQELAAAIPGVQADTLDKLVWEITHEHPDHWPDWVSDIGPDTLVIIDEAGLGGTVKLATAISFINGRGGKVLLVGDDQQRAANGAGGVLRDIEAAHGSLTLNEVMRFQDRGTPGEGVLQGQASLAMRAGDPGCVGFYVDRDRIKAVTADTVVDLVYTAWKTDVAAGADSIMIAPDLDTVAALNARARADRLVAAGGVAGLEIHLPNGETMSQGDIILTKKNQRTLSLGGTDFVKNNHRWLVNRVLEDGSVLATELSRDICRVLPGWYLTAGDVRLGYAHTTASVQGLTVGSAAVPGTAHSIITTSMSRNDAYPALTRGVDANTAWMLMEGVGDDHEVIKPEAIRPATVIEAFTAVITTDGSDRSATTEIREAADPILQLGRPGAAADAYAHAIVAGAEALVGPQEIERITAAAELAVPGITSAAAWDTLRGHLIVLAAGGSDPTGLLTAAAGKRELGTAQDLAAVLDFRLDPTGNHSLGEGPLPWLPAVPAVLAAAPDWAPYLAARGELVENLATQIRRNVSAWTPDTAPAWALPYLGDIELVGELAVWRATQSVPEPDLRPAGERPRRLALRSYHDRFVAAAQRVAGDPMDGATRWSTMIAEHGIDITHDDYWPVLAARLSLADTAGINVPQLLNTAITARPLPADATASALWSRLSLHLGPLVAGPGAGGHRIRPAWTTHLQQVLGETTAERITADPLWPTLVAHIDRAQRDGIAAETVIPAAAAILAATRDTVADHELAAVLLSQLHTLTDPAAEPQPEPAYPDPADADLTAPADAHTADVATAEPRTDRPAETAAQAETDPFDGDRHTTTPDLPGPEPEHHDEPAPEPHNAAPAATDAAAPSQQHPTPATAGPASTPADLVDAVDASQARLYAANAAAAAFFTAQAPQSWVPGYVADRKLDPNLFGYAPAKWTALADHLRQQGFTDAELLAAGLGTTSRRGEVVDRFRDRAVLPITTGKGDIAAFIGRISPTHTDNDTDRPSPKYLNGPGTDIFSKRELPFGLNPDTVATLRAGADIVLVEGPMDALAITAAATAADRPLVPIATNGTALTAEHLAALNDIAPLTKRKVIEAFDSDPAGREAAFRAHTLLAAAGVHNAVSVTALTGKDPAQMLTDTDPAALLTALDQQRPLADLVVDHILSRWPTADGTIESRYNALKEAAPHIAAMTHTQQYRQADRLTTALNKDPFTVLDAIAHADPIRTPAPNPTPTAGGLGLPTPPVLSAQTQARQAEQQRRRAAALARLREPVATTPGLGAPLPERVVRSVPADLPELSRPRPARNAQADMDYEQEQTRYQQERDNEMDWD